MVPHTLRRPASANGGATAARLILPEIVCVEAVGDHALVLDQ